MNAKRWFYGMLSLPILVPLFLGILAHLYYAIVPHPDFSFSLEGNQVHHTFANGTSSHNFRDNPINRMLQWVLMPTAGYPLLIGIICNAVLFYAAPYFIFIMGLIAWSWHRQFNEVRKILWKLPVFAYPLLIVWMILESSNPTFYYKLTATLLLQIIVLPIYFFTAYLYVFIAWRMVPAKFRREK